MISAIVPAATLADVWSLMFGLTDPMGRLINSAILLLFAIAVADLVIAAVRIGQNAYWLQTAEYALSRTGIPQDRIEYKYYGAGHMMYVRDDDRSQLSRDVRDFIRRR